MHLNNRYKNIIILSIVFIIAIVVNLLSVHLSTEKIDGFQIHFIDVGQGDATAIFLPDGKTMLIDAGDSDSGYTVKKHFKRYGIDKIDFLLATHPHEDHIGGMTYVINNFDIGQIYMPKVTYDSSVYTELLDAIDNKNYKINEAKFGVNIAEENDYTIEVLSPKRSDYDEINHYSMIIKLRYKDTSYLFTGDAEVINEKELSGDISSDLLKVGHHGSDTSSSNSFLKRVAPKIAVIHVGQNNRYNHPHDSVMKRFKKLNINVLRTDVNGTIIVKSDGTDITYKGENDEIFSR